MNNVFWKTLIVSIPVILGVSKNANSQNCEDINTPLGQGTCYNTITTAVPFLRISPEARGGALADAGVATSPDANDNHYNVAKMSRNTKESGVSLAYSPWLQNLVGDINLVYLSGYKKFGPNSNQAVSASMRYFNLGDIDFTDINASPLGVGKPREYAFDIGYSRNLGNYGSIGVAGRFVNSNLSNGPAAGNNVIKPGRGGAVDVGYYFNKPLKGQEGPNASRVTFGTAITNLGTKISYNNDTKDFMPTNWAIGSSYTHRIDEFNAITGIIELNKLLVPSPIFVNDTNSAGQVIRKQVYDKNVNVIEGLFKSFGDAPSGAKEELQEVNLSIGAEYSYQNQFFARAGYFYEDRYKGNRKFLSTGFGFKYQVFTLNASYIVPSGSSINRNPLSNTFRFSLIFDVDALKKKKAESSSDEES